MCKGAKVIKILLYYSGDGGSDRSSNCREHVGHLELDRLWLHARLIGLIGGVCGVSSAGNWTLPRHS